MKRILFASSLAVGLVLAPALAEEAVHYTSPGWYVIADTIVGPFVWSGPYNDRSGCNAMQPANEEDADYSCEYLSARPDWDI